MVRPSDFHLNEQTAVNNFFQPDPEEIDPVAPQTKALNEFDALVDKLKSAGINVIVFQDSGSDTPDSIFPNNWISTHSDGRIFLYPMYADNRRKERRSDIVEYFKEHYEVSEVVDLSEYEEQDQFLEGTGSMILDRQNRIAYAALSDRTTLPVLKVFEEKTNFTAIPFISNQSVEDMRLPIYHTNVMMSVGAGFGVVCLESMDVPEEKEIVVSALENTGKEIIDISEEQVHHFTGNVLQLENTRGEKFIVMSDDAYHSFTDAQIGQFSRYGQILHSPIPTIEILGGGYEVMKTNLVNDRGIHICKSMLAYEKFGKGETPENSGIKGDHLVGKYYVIFDQAYKKEIAELISQGKSEEEAKKKAPLILEAQDLLKKWEQKDRKTVALWEKLNHWVYAGFDKTYGTMGISFDKIYHESDTYLLGKDIIEEGLEKKVFYKKEDGSVWVDLTDQGLDEKLVLRSDGTSVYITQDMGTCDFKYNDFPMEKSVYVVGNEQDYHFKVLFSIMKKLGRSYGGGLYHLSYGMVDLPSGKMKSREGTVVDADDLMQEMFGTAEKQTRELGKIEGMPEDEAEKLYKVLGLGALKYFLLKVDPRKRMLFNPQESIEFQGHTGPFIQYTHARISAILRRADQLDKSTTISEDIVGLHPLELDIIVHLSKFPGLVKTAAREYSPAIIAQYVYDLAKAYNAFYQEISIFNEADGNLLELRLVLSENTAKVIRLGMGILGIEVPERM
ncbi:argS [Symbiodinium microadriaticum]|nr:argS [Symbiodinium microadriaticum]